MKTFENGSIVVFKKVGAGLFVSIEQQQQQRTQYVRECAANRLVVMPKALCELASQSNPL